MNSKQGFLLLSTTIAALSYSAITMATSTAPVYTTVTPSQWTIGASALFLQPSYSQAPNYAKINIITLADGSTSSDVKAVNSQYDWGYEAFLGYNFAGNDRDLNISYMHFSNTETNGLVLPALDVLHAYQNNQFSYAAEGQLYTAVDNADINVGQWMHFGPSLALRYYAGLEFAHLKQNFTKNFDKGIAETTTSRTSTFNSTSKYNGIGPKLGAKADYAVNSSNFGIVAGISAAELLGSIEHANSYLYGPNKFGLTNQINEFDAVAHTVTNLNANLAMRYAGVRHNTPLYVELGYRVNEYLNAVYSDNDLTLSGLYLSLALSFL